MTPGERAHLNQAFIALGKGSWQPVEVDNGGDEFVQVRNPKQAMAAIDAVDYSTVIFGHPDGHRGSFVVVLGNDPTGIEVIADYTCNKLNTFGTILDNLGELK